MTTTSFLASKSELGKRIDQLLTSHFPELSRSYFQYLIEENHVLLNGKPVKKRQKVAEGDQITLTLIETPQIDVLPEDIPLEILYEDEHLIAINKPAGMVTHPAPGTPSGTFANALLHHCQSLNVEDFFPLRPGIVHRLDRETSGVLIGAKTKSAHRKLSEQFSLRLVEKRYLAICIGRPPEKELSAPIGRSPKDRKKMTVKEEGKEAISHFTVLAHRDHLSLVAVRLITGRTHQIRVHLQHLGCPILGDPIYGVQKFGAKRQLLHAERLKITHPFSDIPIELIAPLPTDMKNFIDQIQAP